MIFISSSIENNTIPPLSHLANSLAAVVSEHDLYRFLTFQVLYDLIWM